MEKKKAKKFSMPVKTKVKLKELKKMPKSNKEEIVVEKPKSEKEKLLELYDELKALNIRSISDLENLIARAE